MAGVGEFLAGGMCPVTGGNPTSMTEAGFVRACGAALAVSREEEGKRIFGLRYRRCLVCRGEHRPPELRIVGLAAVINEREVFMPSDRKDGVCQSCNKSCSVVSHFDAWVCPSCQIVRINAKKRPEVLVAALERFSPEDLSRPGDGSVFEEELVAVSKILGMEGTEHVLSCARRRMDDLQKALDNNMDLVMENRTLKENAGGDESSLLVRLREVLQAGDGDIVRAAELAMDRQARAGEALADKVDVRKALKAGDDEDLVEVARQRMERLMELQLELVETRSYASHLAEQNSELRKGLGLATVSDSSVPAVLEARECSCSCGLDEMLFDLLLEALGDRVINLSASRIKALREVR